MKSAAIALLSAIASAASVEGIISDHVQLNANYDNVDPDHHYFGTGHPASPAYPTVPKLDMAVDYFDPEGTLFGEHRYQLQTAKTANMLIGTEALREQITRLRDRLDGGFVQLRRSDKNIESNASFNSEVGQLMSANNKELDKLDGRMNKLEDGYFKLHREMKADREAIIMMCHQYAYATTIPDQCQPYLGVLAKPLNFAWKFPSNDCPAKPALPPFGHLLSSYKAPLIQYDLKKW